MKSSMHVHTGEILMRHSSLETNQKNLIREKSKARMTVEH